MSTLKADTIVARDGTSPATLTKQHAAKSWVNWDMAGTTARDSFNLASLTDSGAGNFAVNLSSAHSDANYAAIAYTNAYDGDSWSGGMSIGLKTAGASDTASKYVFKSYNGSSNVDAKYNYSATHGDLA